MRLAEELGSGAVATVHRVVDDTTGAVFAAKILHPRNARDRAAAQRFAREAELAQTLTHPNLVEVHGLTTVEGRTALLMELVEGPTLQEIIAREAPLDEPRLIALSRGIAAGLASAHQHGIIHRDLKPANVLVCETGSKEQPKLADFGMARAASFAGTDTASLTVLGTPPYMAPESLDPLAVDPRADLYALGCIMFEMATGHPPFSAPTAFAMLDAHRKAPIPRLPDRIGSELEALIRDLLAKNPGERPQAASRVVARLDAIDSGSGALVPRATSTLLDAAAAGRCPNCGAPSLAEVGACLECGVPQVRVEPGPMTVFVVGPGKVAEKLSSVSRDALVRWIGSSQSMGLNPAPLEATIPRLPFVLVTGVSARSAHGLVEGLRRLGIHGQMRVGGRLSHGAMIRKAGTMGMRRALMVAGLAFAAGFIPQLGIITFGLALPTLPIFFLVVASRAARPMAFKTGSAAMELPQRMRDRIAQIEQAVGQLADRHRKSLRAVVHRVLALFAATPEHERAALEAEMDHALGLALAATTRMDQLDRYMSDPRFDASDPSQRKALHERDTWAGRLLDMTATLEALGSRLLAAEKGRVTATPIKALSPAETGEMELDELRARVEALEEVQRTGD